MGFSFFSHGLGSNLITTVGSERPEDITFQGKWQKKSAMGRSVPKQWAQVDFTALACLPLSNGGGSIGQGEVPGGAVGVCPGGDDRTRRGAADAGACARGGGGTVGKADSRAGTRVPTSPRSGP